MPFPWLHATIPDDVTGSFPAKRHAMLQREIRERAALLMRLGHSRAATAAACRANLEWEFELEALPPVVGEIDGLVAEVYDRAGVE